MVDWLANAWRVPELRKRLLFTAGILVLYRLGTWLPAPGVNPDQIESYLDSQSGTVPQPAEHLLGRGAVAVRGLCARDQCPTSRRRSSCS